MRLMDFVQSRDRRAFSRNNIDRPNLQDVRIRYVLGKLSTSVNERGLYALFSWYIYLPKFIFKGTYSNAGTNNKCVEWSAPCASGQYETRQASASSDRTCGPCERGTYNELSGQVTCKSCTVGTNFQDLTGRTQCKPIATCAAGTGQASAPTASTDRVCGACVLGSTYGLAGNSLPCQPVSLCPAGTEPSVAPTLSSDWQCTACAAFTFNSAGGNVSLTP